MVIDEFLCPRYDIKLSNKILKGEDMNEEDIKNLKLLSTTWGRACLALKYENRIPSESIRFECEAFFDVCEDINPQLLTTLEIDLADTIEFEMGGLTEKILNEIYIQFLKEIGY